jgi:hypothetical protein
MQKASSFLLLHNTTGLQQELLQNVPPQPT